MMGARDEFAFANDVRAAREADVPRAIAMLIVILVSLVIAFIGWAAFAVVDEVARGDGKVVPALQVQTVQSLEGGIVSEILVAEGERVEKNQILVQLDETSPGSKLGEVASQRDGKLVRVARLTAEAEGLEKPQFPQEQASRVAALVEAEMASFESRKAAQQQQRQVIENQLLARREQLQELDARNSKLTASLELLDKELKLTRKLAQQGAVPEIDLIRLEREAVEARGELEETAARRGATLAGIGEYQNRLASSDRDFRAAARDELTRELAELRIIDETLAGVADRFERTAIRAPVRGIVNRLEVKTIGGVIAPGGAVLEIVPLDDRLVVEARIRPQDVAFIRPGQDANVKLSAYDYTIYGVLAGKVTQVSADTFSDEKTGEAFYKVIVETGQSTLKRNGQELEILPGMVATVDILTGSKTVLNYLAKPVTRVGSEALRER
jgi:adhesin transport system membrane fusion protein